MRQISQLELAEFEKDLVFKQISNPDYRYGQAFLNYFSWIHKLMDEDGDLGANLASRIWNSKSRDDVLRWAYWYIEQ